MHWQCVEIVLWHSLWHSSSNPREVHKIFFYVTLPLFIVGRGVHSDVDQKCSFLKKYFLNFFWHGIEAKRQKGRLSAKQSGSKFLAVIFPPSTFFLTYWVLKQVIGSNRIPTFSKLLGCVQRPKNLARPYKGSS